MTVHVLVPAAGAGRRIGASINKQYLELGDRPILAHTLARLAALPEVATIRVIVPAAECDYCREEVIGRYALAKIAGVVAGGAERQDSVRHGLEACTAAADDLILIHDGVRPFFPREAITELLAVTARDGAAILAIPAQDTVKEVEAGKVVRTLERGRLWQVQTPQAFCFAIIHAAHQQALAAGFTGTDDASLVEWCGGPVGIVAGTPYNFKITTPADLALARALLASGEVTLT